MSLLRAVLLWAVMLAVPFQGYAAASMLGCVSGSAAPRAVVSAPTSLAVSEHHGAHDANAAHAHHAADAAPQHADGDDAPTATPDVLHKCGNCGICHSVALLQAPVACAVPELPPADLAEPARHAVTRAPALPDKPPRA
jgi:hypothetical protein